MKVTRLQFPLLPQRWRHVAGSPRCERTRDTSTWRLLCFGEVTIFEPWQSELRLEFSYAHSGKLYRKPWETPQVLMVKI